jgi:hypothetical protein
MPAHAFAARTAFFCRPALLAAVIAGGWAAAFAARMLALILSLDIVHTNSELHPGILILNVEIPLLCYPAHLHFEVVIDRRFAIEHRPEQFRFVPKRKRCRLDIRPETDCAKILQKVDTFRTSIFFRLCACISHN